MTRTTSESGPGAVKSRARRAKETVDTHTNRVHCGVQIDGRGYVYATRSSFNMSGNHERNDYFIRRATMKRETPALSQSNSRRSVIYTCPHLPRCGRLEAAPQVARVGGQARG